MFINAGTINMQQIDIKEVLKKVIQVNKQRPIVK